MGLAQQKACDHKIEGYIYDITTKKPIAFATVQLKSSSQGAIADEKGYFVLNALCETEVDLVFGHIGYKSTVHHHDEFHEMPKIYLAPKDVVLESVVVEGKSKEAGIATSTITELSAKELAQVQSESLGDVVSQLAGVNTISNGQNIAKPVIHGLHSNRVLVINNGLRHEFQNWGSDHAPEIDPSLAGSVEVIKGAATVRYGPEALGGVILINPAPIELSGHLHADLKLTGKSNGRSGEATLKLQKGFQNFGVMAEASWLKQGDLHAPNYNLTNTGKNEKSFAFGFRYHPIENLDIQLYFSRFDQELGILRGGVNGNLDDLLFALRSDVPNDTNPFTYNITTPKQGIVHSLAKAKMVYANERQSLSLQYGYQFNQRKEFDVRRGNNNLVPNINLELATHSIDLDWDHPEITIAQGKVVGRAGFQYLQQENDNLPGTNTLPFIPNFNNTRFGFYLVEALEANQSTYEFGLRYDFQNASVVGLDRRGDVFRNDLDFQNLSATLGLVKNWNEFTEFRTNIATAWRPPNIAELYRFGRHLTFIEYGLWRYDVTEDNQVTTRNILTEEDRPVDSEVGFKWINTISKVKDKLDWELTGYVNYIKNYIFSKPAGLTRTVRGTAPYFIYDQGDALLWGVDFAARYQHSDRFNSSFNASYLWSKQIENNDNFAGQPPANIHYQLSYIPKISWLEQTEFLLGLNYTFEQFQQPRVIPVEDLLDPDANLDLFSPDAKDFDIIAAPDGYFLADFGVRTSIKQFEINFQVKNLLNTSYRNYTDRLRYFADAVGRNFILSVGYKL